MIRQLITLCAAVSVSACGALPGGAVGDGPPARDRAVTNPDRLPGPEPKSASGNPRFYDQNGQRYFVMESAAGYRERGVASWYGKKFHGRLTSSGEVFDMYAVSAAHKTLPLPTWVRVTNLTNGRSLQLRVNDRGPFVDNRLIDLSWAAARELGLVEAGTGLVEVSAINFTTPSTESATSEPGQLFMQIGAFSDRENAIRLRDRLQGVLAAPTFILSGVTVDDVTIHRVQIGPIRNVPEYDAIETRLSELGIKGGRLVTAPR